MNKVIKLLHQYFTGRQRIDFQEKKQNLSKSQQKKIKNKMKKPNSLPSRLHQHGNMNLTEEEMEIERASSAAIHSLSIQLLDLMHTLHTRAATIYKSWAEEEQVYLDPSDSIDACTNALWVKCWCPLLQGKLCRKLSFVTFIIFYFIKYMKL